MIKRHGMYKTKIYSHWENMKQRCYSKNASYYKNYGGRGIIVCNEWINDFMAFYTWSMKNGYQNNLELDRINNNGNYEPDNCRWITHKEQQYNKRSNRLITYKGKTQTAMEWSIENNINFAIIYARINQLKWNEQDAISIKPKRISRFIIQQYDLNNDLIKEWSSSREIERELKIPHSAIIRSCKTLKKFKNSYWIKKEEIKIKKEVK